MTASALEETFYLLVVSAGFPEPQREGHLLNDARRVDFSWFDKQIAVELQGGVWNQGAHVRGMGYTKDCRKLNELTLAGWRVFWFTADMLSSGEAIKTLRAAWESGM